MEQETINLSFWVRLVLGFVFETHHAPGEPDVSSTDDIRFSKTGFYLNDFPTKLLFCYGDTYHVWEMIIDSETWTAQEWFVFYMCISIDRVLKSYSNGFTMCIEILFVLLLMYFPMTIWTSMPSWARFYISQDIGRYIEDIMLSHRISKPSKMIYRLPIFIIMDTRNTTRF